MDERRETPDEPAAPAAPIAPPATARGPRAAAPPRTSLRGLSHRAGLLLLAGLALALLFRVVVLGHVVFPHDNTGEVGLSEPTNPDRLSSQRFTDASLIYVPSVHHQLNGARSGWLVTWDPHTELGKPANQLAGLGKAFLPTHVVSFLTRDALRAYTLLVVLAVVLGALFGYLFLQELGLHPVACFTGAAGLGLGFFTSYWLTFAIFLWGTTWTLGLLWGVARFVRRPGLGWLAWIAFTVHALFLSAYPQAIVWSAYVTAGFALVRVARARSSWRARLALVAALGAAAVVGLASVAPAYLDLALETRRSGRTELQPNFFTSTLPEIGSLADVGFFLRRLYDDLWYGNPVDSEHVHVKRGLKGLCYTPVFLGLLALSFTAGLRRRLWGWQLFVLATAVMTAWPAFYVFGVRYLGLSFSRWLPLGAAWIPILVLCAYAVDAVVRGGEDAPPRVRGVLLAALPAALALLGILAVPERPDATLVAAALALSLGVCAFAWTRHPAWIVAATAGCVLHYGWSVSLTRPAGEIALSSPLVESMRGLTAGGRRYALVDASTRILRSNMQPLVGLRTIHAYDSLSPQAYRHWAIRLNGQGDLIPGRTEWQLRKLLVSYGRVFNQIEPSPELAGPMLSFAGVSLVLSQVPLEVDGFKTLARGLYQPERPALLAAQLTDYAEPEPGEVAVAGFLPDTAREPVERVRDEGDRQRYLTTPVAGESVLFISQQHHPYWSASADGRPLETVRVNDLYQGVRLPPGTAAVDLSFRPLVRWAWLPQLGFVVLGLTLGLARLARARRPRA